MGGDGVAPGGRKVSVLPTGSLSLAVALNSAAGRLDHVGLVVCLLVLAKVLVALGAPPVLADELSADGLSLVGGDDKFLLVDSS